MRLPRGAPPHARDPPPPPRPPTTPSMSIFWMLPQYILIGVGDVFSSVGILEFFYEQSPRGCRASAPPSSPAASASETSSTACSSPPSTAPPGRRRRQELDRRQPQRLAPRLLLRLPAAARGDQPGGVRVGGDEVRVQKYLSDGGDVVAGMASRETEMAGGGKGKVVERSKVIDAPLVVVEEVRAV